MLLFHLHYFKYKTKEEELVFKKGKEKCACWWCCTTCNDAVAKWMVSLTSCLCCLFSLFCMLQWIMLSQRVAFKFSFGEVKSRLFQRYVYACVCLWPYSPKTTSWKFCVLHVRIVLTNFILFFLSSLQETYQCYCGNR